MGKGWRIEKWRGDDIAADVKRAAVAAVDETTAACADQAASGRSGASANLTSEPASESGGMITGRWGLFPEPHGGADAFHELFVETGTAFTAGDQAKRRAADQEYPNLAGRIRANRSG